MQKRTVKSNKKEQNMAKTKTSKKQKKSSSKSKPVTLTPHKVLDKSILDPETLKELLIETLIEGDMEAFQDVLIAQIRLANKTKLARNAKIGRQTLYDLTQGKREFNPSVKTLSAILQALYKK